MKSRMLFEVALVCTLILSVSCTDVSEQETEIDVSEQETNVDMAEREIVVDTSKFPKHVEIFGLHVYGTASAPDDKVLHAASVLAEYLDSDEDGVPDNQKIVDAMVSKKATVIAAKNMDELRKLGGVPFPNWHNVWVDNIGPQRKEEDLYDQALEEILHLITDYGWEGAYPSVFGRWRGTEIAQASEAARGGYFEEVPEKYPEGAWHTYYAESCRYGCQIGEYIHWGLTSILGGHERYWKKLGGKDQWDLRTKEKVKSGDPTLYALLTDPQYKLPTVLPDGKYKARTLTIEPYRPTETSRRGARVEGGFTKQVEVFGIHIYATEKTGDDKILHAASVLAEYLDNDEDGTPDNPLVVDAMLKVGSSIIMGYTGEELDSQDKSMLPAGPKQGLYDVETHPNPPEGVFDGALEEVLHPITRHGYGGAYPDAFGMRQGSLAAQALDLARGGYYEEVPEQYPEDAWFTYYDETCRYSCMLNEYIYWALTSLLGAQDSPGRLERIGNEWRLNTPEKLRKGDPAICALLTDPQYKMPTVLPDGKYRAKTFTILPVAAESHRIDDRDRGLSEHFIVEARPSERPDFEIIPLDNLNGVLDRKIVVFGIPVFAYSGVSDEDLVRTAHVTAQWLDNDEDGNVDNRLILDELAKHNAYVFIVENQEQVNSYNFQNNTEAYSLDAESINRDWYSEEGPTGRADGTMEEPFHMISDVGYGNLYPEAFARREGTELANAMDIARGGHFERTPDKYPDGAWYTYDDKGCGYRCMASEYFYKGMISILGVNGNRGDAIKDVWKLYTRELVESKDPKLFHLLTNPEYKFPTKAPDGTYGK